MALTYTLSSHLSRAFCTSWQQARHPGDAPPPTKDDTRRAAATEGSSPPSSPGSSSRSTSPGKRSYEGVRPTGAAVEAEAGRPVSGQSNH